MPDLEYISNEYDGRLEVIGIQQLGIDSVADGQIFVDEFGSLPFPAPKEITK